MACSRRARGVVAVVLAVAPGRMRLHAVFARAAGFAARALVVVHAERRELRQVGAGLFEEAEVGEVQAIDAGGQVHAAVRQLVELAGGGVRRVGLADAGDERASSSGA